MIEFKAIDKVRSKVKANRDNVYKRRVALVTEIVSPYRIPLLNKVNNCESLDLKVFFMAKTENRRDWSVDMDELEFAYEILSGFTIQRKHNNPYYLNSGVFRKLRQFDPKVVICGNYNSFAAFLALVYSRIYRKRFVLWCESTKNDVRRSRFAVELYKKIFVMLCDYYLVPGGASYEYLQIHFLC